MGPFLLLMDHQGSQNTHTHKSKKYTPQIDPAAGKEHVCLWDRTLQIQTEGNFKIVIRRHGNQINDIHITMRTLTIICVRVHDGE